MTTSAELEALKSSIRKMPASPKRGNAVYEALLLWMPLQTDEDWVRLVHEKTKKLNQREIAAEVCASDNIWKKERFRVLLGEMNALVEEKGLLKVALPYLERASEAAPSKNKKVVPVCDEDNPLKKLQEVRLRAELRKTESKLQQANVRIRMLEKELKKYTGLSELNRALEQLVKPRR